jgi:hypothetical protein
MGEGRTSSRSQRRPIRKGRGLTGERVVRRFSVLRDSRYQIKADLKRTPASAERPWTVIPLSFALLLALIPPNPTMIF